MSWFRRRPREIVVTHRVEIPDLVRAAEIARGWHDPKPPETPASKPKPVHEEEFEGWLARFANEHQVGHYRALYDIYTGKRPPEGSFTRAKAREILATAGVPLLL